MTDDPRPGQRPAEDAPAPTGLLGRVRAKLAGRDFLKNVLTLMTGTASSQVLMFVAMLFVARLFTPTEYGVYALVMAAVQMVLPIALGRYELAVVLPRRDNDARQLLRLGTVINVGVCLAVTVAMIFLAPWVASVMVDPTAADAGQVETSLRSWLYAVGPIAFLMAQLVLMSYWLTRTKNFRQISQNKIFQSASVSGMQIGTGLIGMGVSGLVLATIAGQAASLLNLLSRTKGQYRIDGPAASKGELAKRYIKMPTLNGPNALVDAVRINGINFMIGPRFSAAAVGQFGMAWRLLQAPMGLINAAISQVFFQRLANVRRGGMLRIVRQALVRSALIGVVPFTLIFLLAPWILPLVLGQQWQLAGDIARVLTPWLYLNFITSPISTVFVVVKRQFTMLLFSIAYMATPLTIIALGSPDLLRTMGWVAWGMAGLLVVFLGLALLVSWQYDRGFGWTPEEDVEDDTPDETVERAEQVVTEEDPLER